MTPKIVAYPNYIYQPVSEVVIQNPKVDGVCIWTALKYFLMLGNNFSASAITTLAKQIEHIADAGKFVTLLIQTGSQCSTPFYNTYPSIYYKRKEGLSGTYTMVKVPLPYNEDYYEKITAFVEWFTIRMKQHPKAWNAIKEVKVIGVNADSLDFRIDSQRWDWTTDANVAYSDMADLWLQNDYDSELAYGYCQKFLEITCNYFDGKEVCLPAINGLNGFPCIKGTMRCLPEERTDYTGQLIQYGKDNYSKFITQITYFGTFGTVPERIANNPNGCTLQTNTKYGNLPSGSESTIRALIAHAEQFNCIRLELFDHSLKFNPNW